MVSFFEMSLKYEEGNWVIDKLGIDPNWSPTPEEAKQLLSYEGELSFTVQDSNYAKEATLRFSKEARTKLEVVAMSEPKLYLIAFYDFGVSGLSFNARYGDLLDLYPLSTDGTINLVKAAGDYSYPQYGFTVNDEGKMVSRSDGSRTNHPLWFSESYEKPNPPDVPSDCVVIDLSTCVYHNYCWYGSYT